jgi:hypothetical protein
MGPPPLQEPAGVLAFELAGLAEVLSSQDDGAAVRAAAWPRRDLCRTRADKVQDLTRARNLLGKFLLRHGQPWRDGSTWTQKYQAWLRAQRFQHPATTNGRPLGDEADVPTTS